MSKNDNKISSDKNKYTSNTIKAESGEKIFIQEGFEIIIKIPIEYDGEQPYKLKFLFSASQGQEDCSTYKVCKFNY